MEHPLSRNPPVSSPEAKILRAVQSYAGSFGAAALSPQRGTTPTAWLSQFRGVCVLCALVRQAPNSLEN
jgi:hypothetical protein